MTTPVNVDNFVRAETARYFDGILELGVGVNQWVHFREPSLVENQTVIRMNRDTLYSSAIVDISEGATVTLPDAASRYMTMMVVNEDHFINRVYDEPGSYELTMGEHGTPFVLLALRTFIDPSEASDIARVNALQDAVNLEATSARPYVHPDYEGESLDSTREALLKVAEGLPDSEAMFGKKVDVDPVRHLLGAAVGWGGLPETEAYYYIETEPRSMSRYTMTFKNVPVDGFWSVTIYNRDGYLEENPYNAYSLNNLTAVAADDGTVTLNLTGDGEGLTNHLYVMDGWNYTLRLYKPHEAVLNKTWTPPEPQPVS